MLPLVVEGSRLHKTNETMAIYAKIVDSIHSCKGDDIELDFTTGAGVSLTEMTRLKKTLSANVF